MPAAPTTRFADFSRRQALLAVALTVAGILWCLSAALTPQQGETAPPANGGDLQLYRSIVENVHAGENYYEAAGRELRSRGYPTASLFNWRPPLSAWFIGNLPSPRWGQAVLGILALLTLLQACGLLWREGGGLRVAVGTLPLIGALHWCIDGDAFLAQELWAGVLVALSICFAASGRWHLGLATGLGALFLRELALPYALLALFFAWRRQRRQEVVGWCIGLALYAGYMAVHALAVANQIQPGDRVPGSWLRFGGAGFVLVTCRMNAYLFRAPLWVSAFCLPLALLGLAAWRGETGRRLAWTTAAYVAAFAVVGQPFNDYWGLLDAPLLALGFATAPEAVRDLFRALRLFFRAGHAAPAQ